MVSNWFPPYIYCNFTLDNSKLPLTQSHFCFPSFRSFLYNFTLDNWLKPCFKRMPVETKNCAAVRNIDWVCFKTTMNSLYSFNQNINISLPCALEVRYAWWLYSFPIPFPYKILQQPKLINKRINITETLPAASKVIWDGTTGTMGAKWN